jgi:hypothetical protein
LKVQKGSNLSLHAKLDVQRFEIKLDPSVCMQPKVTKRNLKNLRERERERERLSLQGGISFMGYGVLWYLCGGTLST